MKTKEEVLDEHFPKGNKKRKEKMLQLSDFYWGIAAITTLQLFIAYKILNQIHFLYLGIIMFIVMLLVGHNKRLRVSLDFHKEAST